MSRGRVVFAVVGSYGDAHPFMALALEMKRRGWSPLLLAAPEYADKAAAAGLEFAPMRPGAAELEARWGGAEGVLQKLATSDEALMRDFLLPEAENGYADALPHVQGARLVVTSHLAFGAQLAAEAAGTPVAALALQPMVLLSAYDPPSVINAPWLPGLRRVLGPAAVRPLLKLGWAAQRPLAERLQGSAPRLGSRRWKDPGWRRASGTPGPWSGSGPRYWARCNRITLLGR